MEVTTSHEKIEFNGTIEITDLTRKYFTPINRSIDSSKVVLRPNVNAEEYLRKREEALNKSRHVTYSLRVEQSHTEDGQTFYHRDYNYKELASLVLFKRPLSELSLEDNENLESFINSLFHIMALYKEDYWLSYYENYDDFSSNPFIQEAIEEVRDVFNVLKMREDIILSELVLRHKDKYGSVIIDETTKVNDIYKEDMFNYYAQYKYQNLLHRFKLTRFLTDEEKALNIPIKEAPNTIWEFDKEISLQIDLMTFSGVTPSCNTDFFEKLVDNLVANMSFSPKLSPIYEFLKLVVPALNNFINDHAHEKYKKKDKHFLLFSILRLFNLVPQKHNLDVNGLDDVKEDFIKQLIRK